MSFSSLPLIFSLLPYMCRNRVPKRAASDIQTLQNALIAYALTSNTVHAPGWSPGRGSSKPVHDTSSNVALLPCMLKNICTFRYIFSNWSIREYTLRATALPSQSMARMTSSRSKTLQQSLVAGDSKSQWYTLLHSH